MNQQQPGDKKSKLEKVVRYFLPTTVSVNNRTSVLVLTTLIIILGFTSYRSMPKENFPEISIPTILINTPYPGNSPVDIENLITRPIENELLSLTGLKNINSTSIQDFSNIVVEFNLDVDVNTALRDVKDAVDKAKTELPTDLDQDPNVFELDFSEFPIMNINLSGDFTNEDLKEFGEYLKDEIEKLTEISEVEIKGALEKEVRIMVDPFKMQSLQINFDDIENAIASENITISGGDLLIDNFRRSVRVVGEFKEMRDIENVIVKHENQNTVFLKDIATVQFGFEERQSYARSYSDPVISLDVKKRSAENLLVATDKINDILDYAIENIFPPNLEISITNDQSKVTRDQLDNLENSIIFGVILVVLVLLFFLGLRNALFVGIAIPLSMLTGFMVLNGFGVTVNLIVLFSLVLALGMLVDNGIVVVENIYRLMQEGHSPISAAKQGAGEVAWAIIVSTATTLAAFVPLLFWDDIIGEFMKYLPVTLIIVLASSLFVALIINPVLTSLFMRIEDPKEKTSFKKVIAILSGFALLIIFSWLAGWIALRNISIIFALITILNIYLLKPAAALFQDKILVWIENAYDKTITFVLKGFMPYIVFISTFLLLILSIVLFSIFTPKVSFFPENEPNYVNIFIELPLGSDIDYTNEYSKSIEKVVNEVIEPYGNVVESVITNVGEGTTDPMAGPAPGRTPHRAKVTVAFVEFEFREGVSTNSIMEAIRERMSEFPEATISVDKNQVGPPVGRPINIEVSGDDFQELTSLTDQIITYIDNGNIQGIEELQTDLERGKPELLINVDREAARRYGISTAQIGNTMRTALFGREVSKFKEGEDEYPIQLRFSEEYRYDLSSLMNQRITFRDAGSGQIMQVPISAVADVTYTSTFGSIRRIDGNRTITIYSNVMDGYNANEIVNSIRARLENFSIPDGYEISFTGEQEEQEKTGEFLTRALMIAVFLILFIIVTQFNSLVTPFIILLSVLFSTMGVFFGLALFQMDFVIVMTGIGIISLAGVVVNNAIVLIDYTNLVRQRKRAELKLSEGKEMSDNDLVNVIIKGGKLRLRPVLLTAITTILGLMPLALGLNIDFAAFFTRFEFNAYIGGDNALFWGPMASTVIFGLTFSTFLILVVVPAMYLISERWKRSLNKFIS
ncbi:MAG: efflux RND transporter permease subunit [Chitinophagaceae bacterium]|nr:MAG: efflux RND transporter permease subunit [Chitinophagaceae bacterium]